MYRDPLEAAKERYAQARAEADAAPAALTHALFDELPERSQTELRELDAASKPASATVEAFGEAAKSAQAYAAKLREAADLLAQLKFERDVGMRPTRRVGPWLIAGAGVVAAAAVLWYAPPKLVSYGSAAATDCFGEEAASGEADWLRCRQRKWLWPALAFPHTRATARDKSAEIEVRIASQELASAVRGPLDAARRDEAARRVLDASKPPLTDVPPLEGAGAFEVLATHEAVTDGFAEKTFAASLLAADLDRSHTLAAGDARSDYGQAAYDKRRGAWLCLHGRVDEGIEILSELSRRGGRYEQNEIRPILVACGATSAQLGFDPRNVFDSGASSAVTSLDWASGWQAGRRAAFVDHVSSPASVERLAELVVTRDRAAKEILRWVAPARSDYKIDWSAAVLMPRDTQRFATVWSLRRARKEVVLADTFEKAAARLEQLAATTSSPLEAADPALTETAAEPHYELLGIGGEARSDPATYLRRAAWALELEAAAEWVRRGDAKRALAAAEAAERHAPPLLAWLTGAIRQAAGDAPGAERVIEAYLASPAASEAVPGDLCLARIQLAHSLIAQDRWADALQVARKAAKYEPIAGGAPIDAGTLESAGWLAVALALREGGDAEVDGVHAPEPLPWTAAETTDSSDPLMALDLGGWRALALTSPEERRRVRVRFPSLGNQWPSQPDAIPAVMYVAGRIAAGVESDHGEVEVWLDHAFGDEMLASWDGGLRVALLARAEAARWRGDEESARRWTDRAVALFAPVKDERTALLAFYAGL